MASIAQLRRAAVPFAAAAAARRRLLSPSHRSLLALSPPLSAAAQRSRLSPLFAAAAQRPHLCTATSTAAAASYHHTSEENYSVLQRLVDKYCFEQDRTVWPAVVEEILTRRQRRADGGEVVRECLWTRGLITRGKYYVGAKDPHAELWKDILTDYVPFNFKRDHGGEKLEKLRPVVEELGEMCVNGEIIGVDAYKLVTSIMEDMAKEMKANQPPEEVKEKEKSKGKKKK